jgi:Ca2+-binding RTX toxin-like protein
MVSRRFCRKLRLEGLESRRVLAAGVATLSDGVLSIEGTHKNDKIVVSLAGEDLTQLSVKINKSTTLFSAADVTSLVINAGNGNDRVVVAESVLIPAQIFGGKGNDWLTGGGAIDVIYGGAGNDKLDGGSGDDQLLGEAGQDRLRGGMGSDGLWGGAGHDRLEGGAGNDFLYGEAGHDQLRGGDDDDQLFGGDGKDLLYGQNGNDWLDGGVANDKLIGGEGDDSLLGGDGNDHLDGGAGVNLLDGGGGTNKLKGGTVTDLDQPPPPPQNDGPEYITFLSAEGGSHAQLVYQVVGGTPRLTIDVEGAEAYQELTIVVGGVELGLLIVNGEGAGQIVFSASPEGDEHELPFELVDGAAVQIGLLLAGPMNLSQPV